MRIITGRFRGKRIHAPDNIPTRPTTDVAKTGLFNILNNHIDFPEISLLDLFAGTGNISYEFASRGCENITCVDLDAKCAAFIKRTADDWKIKGLEVVKADVFKYIEQCKRKFDIIFAGPPYPLENLNSIPDLIFEKNLLNENGWLILETSPRHSYEEHPNFFHRRHYGETNFHFFRHKGIKEA